MFWPEWLSHIETDSSRRFKDWQLIHALQVPGNFREEMAGAFVSATIAFFTKSMMTSYLFW